MSASGALLLGSVNAWADDNIQPDGDTATNGLGPIKYGSGGRACDTRGTAVVGEIKVNWNGNGANGDHHFAPGEALSVAFEAVTGITVTATPTSIPTDWNDQTDSVSIPLSTTVAASRPDGATNIDLTVTGATSNYAAGDGSGHGKPHISVDVSCGSGGSGDPVPVNHAPTVLTAAGDALGTEGQTLQTGGSFSDPDGDALTVTANNAVGTFVGNANGSWSWSLGTNDDVALATVTVTATDGGGLTATDAFDYRALNANPVVGVVTATATAACSASVSAAFTDAGSADTHTATVDWGDGAVAATVSGGTASAPSHTYATNGVKTITIAVTDDDGGSGSNSGTFATKLTPSSFMAPINTGAGPRSVFKLGSTIPVKITVTDCTGARVTTLTPTVQLAKVDNVPDGSVNEDQVAETPTNGKNMTWVGDKYLFTLSTKNSQFNGGANLTAGSYRLWVTDASFFGSPIATFDLK